MKTAQASAGRSRNRAGSRAGFSIIELTVVVLIIGLMTYAVSVSFEAMVPGERLNTSVRELASTLRDTRREAITRNKDFYLLYDLDQNRYREITPFLRGGGLFISGYHADDERLLGNWEPLREGVEFEAIVLAGERYEQGQVLVHFDPSGSASEHYVILTQPSYSNQFTVEVLALTGLIRFHEGLYQREPPQAGDFD
ncbi:MAG: GspH/FimT family pseudopilin [Planctomycetes bacterium]|nr:GspH/FimT family pseudopilin [Planctomycetota bacterium]MCB9909201.1 GspH/FimT family pseudopilin [Planctomycetota bacterium]MCB9913317.1 GspH/FimT family pseudopilin [Planctomycetota bacterium]HRV81316.1 prepilin-type N-terminal cleavage/methylation domain-containing protein [Planctomycetota bacterium]